MRAGVYVLAACLCLFALATRVDAQTLTVANGQTAYRTTVFAGAPNECRGCHMNNLPPNAAGGSGNHLLASNNIAQMNNAITNSNALMGFTFTGPPNATQRRQLTMFIGQYVAPSLTGASTITARVRSSGNVAGTVNVFPRLRTDGSSGVAQDGAGGVTVPVAPPGGSTSVSVVDDLAGVVPEYNITYTPNGTVIGSDTVTFRITNPTAPGGVDGTISVTVVGITSGNLTTTTGAAVNYPVTTGGAAATSISIISGALPPGLSIVGTSITGTVPANGSGTYNFRVQANTALGNVDKDITFTVVGVRLNGANAGAVPAVIAAPQGAPIATQTFSTNGTTAGANPFSVAVGTLPTNLVLNTASGQLTGTPVAGGNTNVTIRVATTLGNVDLPVQIQIAFGGTPGVSNPATASGTVGTAVNLPFTASNPAITAVGSSGLPPGLSFVIVDGATGAVAITGTPTQSQNAGNSNVFNATLNATNGLGTGVNSNIAFTINPNVVPTLSTATLTPSQNVAFNYDVRAGNVTNLPVSVPITTFAATGLPAGFSISAAGVISGTTTVSGGPFVAQITATNAVGTSAMTAFTFNVTPTLVPGITAPTAVAGTIGTALAPVSIVASNPPVTAYGATDLPPGVTVNPATGVISGTPTAHGVFNATLTATNAAGTGSMVVPFTIAAIPPAAGAATMTVPLNTATTLNLAPFITGTGITGVRIETNPSFGTVTASGTSVTYTPRTDYFGADSFTYVAFGASGTSPAGTVTITIVGRPDPTRQANVIGTVSAQIDAAQRFARAQISNFSQRLESLHGGGRRASPGAQNQRQPPVASAPAFVDPFAAIPERSVDGGRDPGAVANMPAPAARSAGHDAPRSAAAPAASARNERFGDAGVRSATDVFGLAAAPDPRASAAAHLAAAGTMAPTQVDAAGALLRLNGGGLAADLVSAVSNKSVNLAQVTGAGAGAQPASTVGGIDLWIEGSVNWGNRGLAANGGQIDFSTNGVSFGVDRRFSEQLALGVGAGFARDRTEIGSDGSKSTARGGAVAVYGSYQATPSVFVDAMVGAGKLDFDSERFVAPINAMARSERDGTQIFASLAAGVEVRRGTLLFSPYGRIDLSYDKLHAATETGVGQFALHYFGERTRSTQGALGLRAESVHETSYGWFAPRARVEVRHSFEGDHVSQIAYADLIGTRYALSTAAVERNAVMVGIGGDFHLHGGLSLGVEYQLQKASEGSSQGIRLRLMQALDGKAVRRPAVARAIEGQGSQHHDSSDVRVDFGFTYDDNVSRGRLPQEVRRDTNFNFAANKTEFFPLTDNENMRVMLVGTIGGDKFHSFNGLDRMFAGVRGELQYRPSADFGSPILALFGRFTGEHFESELRRGLRASVGASVRYPLTDRILLFGALAHNERWAKSKVFDARDNSAQLNLDYALSRDSTLYVSGEYRKGDLVATGLGSLENIDIAKVFVADDAFPGMFAYKVDAKAGIFTLGYNLSFGARDSLDFSWRRARATPDARPGFNAPGPWHYIADQFSLVYLVRF